MVGLLTLFFIMMQSAFVSGGKQQLTAKTKAESPAPIALAPAEVAPVGSAEQR